MDNGNYPSLVARDKGDSGDLLTPSILDPIIKSIDKVDKHLWVSFEAQRDEESNVATAFFYDRAKTQEQKVKVVGVTPELYEVTGYDYVDKYWQSNGMPEGELLYTAGGSQGVAMSTFTAKSLGVDPLSRWADEESKTFVMQYETLDESPWPFFRVSHLSMIEYRCGRC